MRGAFFGLAFLLVSCGSEPRTAPVVPRKAPAPVVDQSGVFPKEHLTGTEVIQDHLLGKPFMPGGTIAHYKNGKLEYDLFVTKLPTATDAAILLPDWRKALTDAQLVPSFGGYSGADAGRPVFVFAKGAWIAGVAGLPQREADLRARTLAAALR